MSDSLVIREFADADEPGIRDLFETVVGRPFPPDRFRWLFIDNPLGRGVCPVAELDGRVVGSTASVAVPFRHRGRDLDIYRLQDALVDEVCRGQGVYTKLMQESSRLFDERHVPFVFGFPNENSRWLFENRGGYTPLQQVPTLRLRFADLAAGTGGLEFRSEPAGAFTAADAELFDRCWADVPLHTLRSPAYLTLRYSPQVGRDYVTVRGYRDGELAVLVIGKYFAPEKSIDVVEIVGPADAGEMAAALHALRAAVSGGEADAFESWFWGANPLCDIAAETGFVEAVRTTNLIWRADPAFGETAPGDGELLLTMGDSDVY